jgi:carbamoyl-phosphate synthase small subunit
VQYHPEAAAGPHDSAYLFDRFIDLMAAAEGQQQSTAKSTPQEEN